MLRRSAGAALAALALAVPAHAERGRDLYLERCSSCHGLDARGVDGVAPSLHGVGAGAADFYLSTGRMPMDEPTGRQPERTRPELSRAEIDALVGYAGSLGGPPLPEVHPERGDLRTGLEAYTSFCAGCHQIAGEGGVVTGAVPPALHDATPVQIAEAVRIGPYLMPPFDEGAIDAATLDSIVRYVESTRSPDDRGGWSLGHLGPIPEGMVAWLVAGAALVLAARLIGSRRER